MDDSRVKDASTLLRAFFDEEELRKGGEYAQFFGSWKSIVGERAASHSRVADIDKGNLVVEAEHPGWIQILQLRQADILSAARQRFPELELRGIVFRLGKTQGLPDRLSSPSRPGPFGPGGKMAQEAAAPVHPADTTGGEAYRQPICLDQIGDPELKERLAALKRAMDGGDEP
jgi:hypothetical protein